MTQNNQIVYFLIDTISPGIHFDLIKGFNLVEKLQKCNYIRAGHAQVLKF